MLMYIFFVNIVIRYIVKKGYKIRKLYKRDFFFFNICIIIIILLIYFIYVIYLYILSFCLYFIGVFGGFLF